MRRFSLALLPLLLSACGDADAPKGKPAMDMPGMGAPAADAPAGSPPRPVLYGNLGKRRREITTRSPEAQKWFDQGLTLLYAYNHDEAIRSFREAFTIDPSCAMAQWGLSLANGPHINNPALDPEHAKAAWDALLRARALSDGGKPVEKALIEALGRRYAKDPAAPRAPLDAAYADAMRAAWKAFPDDADVGVCFAESLMDLRPWDLWTLDGKPQPGTEELVSVLEAVLAKEPEHPAANHFYIHATEASPHPEKALDAAKRLADLVPGAGHLVHMPAHVYMRIGRYEDAAEANESAILVDEVYLGKSAPPGFYSMYVAHNYQFLCAAAMMEGRSAVALKAARDMVALVPPEMVEAMAAMIDGPMALPYFAMVRFGKWDEILAEKAPNAKLPLTTAVWHFARGMALHGKLRARGEPTSPEAAAELEALHQAQVAAPTEAKFGLSPAGHVLQVAFFVLAAQTPQGIASERDATPVMKDIGEHGVRMLREAVAIEDGLRYNEPADWVLPVRHWLGAALLEAGKAKEAEEVYREDLRRNPENGWALRGLVMSLKAQKKDATEIEVRFLKAWKKADVEIPASRF